MRPLSGRVLPFVDVTGNSLLAADLARGEHRKRFIMQGIGIALVTLLMIPLSLEIGFRLIPQAIPLDACTSSPVLALRCQWWYAYDRPLRIGYTYRPNYHHEGPFNPADPSVIGAQHFTCAPLRDETFTLVLDADENGFLNPDPLRNHYDIVMTGDSFSQPFSQIFWWEDLQNGTGMTGLNVGMDGWGPLAEAAALRQYGLQKNPQWVILMYFEGNDLFNVEEYHRRQESGLTWRDYQLKDIHGLDRLILPNLIRYWAGISRPDYENTEPDCQFPMTVYTEVNTFDTIFFDVHIDMLGQQRTEIEPSPEWALTTQTLLDLKRDVEAQNGRLLLVYIPAKEHVAWGRLWEAGEVNNFLARTIPLRTFQEYDAHIDDQMLLMNAFARENGFDYLNLYYPFRKGTLRGHDLYNFADVHWNAEGNSLTAQIIANYILAQTHP